MLRGAEDLKAVCRKHIHPEPLHTNASGTLSWEEVECLGACVNAPMVMIFKDTYEDLTPERLEQIIGAFEAGQGDQVKVGPQIDRHLSVPVGGLTTLNSFEGEDNTASSSVVAAASSASSGDGASPSQAGRVDTNAAETDPRLQSPGKASPAESSAPSQEHANADAAKIREASVDGSTGGTQQGPTGQNERDSAEFGSGSGSASGKPRSDGPLSAKGVAAEEAVVSDAQRVPGDAAKLGVTGTDLSNRAASPSERLEGERTETSDTTLNPTSNRGPSGSENRSVPGTDENKR